MGSQMPAGNVRSRTYWTQAMERYFIDLMLEQMHRGNRIGHTFTKQAWNDMLSTFNAKFTSQYDKDVLKSRYTNLWKQFNDIKNLLNSGFLWDETRQMVIADDCTWDAYIKVHPEARSFKTKAVLNFNDLFLIYGHTSADGRYSRSSHDIDFDDEVQGVNIVLGDGMDTLASTSNDRSRTDWTSSMDQYFIEIMLDQIGRGNRIDNTFNKQAWTDMLALFNAKFGPQHGKRVLRHRYKKLWKYHTDITTLLKQDGFYWDESQRMIVGNDDAWDTYIKAHPQARMYRTNILPNYSDLALIYRDITRDGLSSHPHQDKDLEDGISIIKTGKWRQTPAGSDRSRTFWTPPMDRYLINLLLDQVYRGNKLGQTFITQAWIDMLASFNAYFCSHHDKDVIKNRYKHLKRQYNDIKVLLGQIGFSWDETREMITAEDYVWDAYTKTHPDARSYRVKTVPCYHKLCVIFGEEIFAGSYSRLGRNVETNNEQLPVLMTSEEKNGEMLINIGPARVEWNPQMDQYFIDLVLGQVHGGNKSGYTFNEQAWAHMIELFNEKFGLQSNISDLEDRYNFLMKQHNDIRNLLNSSGFMWDETKQLINADNNNWEAYIKEHPDAVSYKGKALENYNSLCKIYGYKGESNGKLGFECQGLEIEQEAQEIDLDVVPVKLQYLAVDTECSDPKRKHSSTTPDLVSCKKMQKTGKEMQEAISGAGAFRKMVTKKEDTNNDSIGTAIDALQDIPGIDDELRLDACDLLEDERKAKTFLALDVTLRKKWLLRKLNSHSGI